MLGLGVFDGFPNYLRVSLCVENHQANNDAVPFGTSNSAHSALIHLEQSPPRRPYRIKMDTKNGARKSNATRSKKFSTTRSVGSNYIPQEARRIDRRLKNLPGDGDVWVERKLTIGKKPKTQVRSYYRSVKTGDCVWYEPPSGASYVVMQSELDQYSFLKEFATEPLGKPLWTIEKSRPVQLGHKSNSRDK